MALATLEQLKEYMSIPVDKIDPAKDELLEAFLNRVSARIETYCGRTFASAEYTEYRDGRGLPYIYTNQYPITTVSGIWDDYDWSWADATLISSTFYRVSNDGNSINFHDYTLTEGVENIKIIYTAGYSTLPLDLVQVCLEEVVIAWKAKSNPGLISITMEDGSIQRNSTNFLPSSMAVLNKYRKPVMI